MELRHLRYFIAVAETGSLTLAAKKRLHTAQPSLSRQIRDLEYEVGVPLMSRSVHGIELTAAGRAFLDHARLAVTQAEAAKEAARRAAPAKPTFALGFLTGKEIDWLPEAMRILHDELPDIEVTVSSREFPGPRGRLDPGQARRRVHAAGRAGGRAGLQACDYGAVHRRISQRPPPCCARRHRTARDRGRNIPHPVEDGPNLALVIEDYLKRSGLDIIPDHEVDNITHAVSMIASTGAVALLPAYPNNLLPWSVTSRPLVGEPPPIDLVLGYHKANTSPILRTSPLQN